MAMNRMWTAEQAIADLAQSLERPVARMVDLIEAELMLIRAEDHLRNIAWRVRVRRDEATWNAIEILRTARCEVLKAQLVEERKA